MTSRGLENLQVVRQLFDAMGNGDLGTLRQLLSDDVTLGRNLYADISEKYHRVSAK